VLFHRLFDQLIKENERIGLFWTRLRTGDSYISLPVPSLVASLKSGMSDSLLALASDVAAYIMTLREHRANQ
jgi:hypothetical protein